MNISELLTIKEIDELEEKDIVQLLPPTEAEIDEWRMLGHITHPTAIERKRRNYLEIRLFGRQAFVEDV